MKLSAQISFFHRISFLDKLLFTKHLATMVKAGIPIAEALNHLVTQTKSKPFHRILAKILIDVDNGQSLYKSLAKYPAVFDEFYLSLIAVGEESGTLEQNLEFLSLQLSKDYALGRKIQGAMLYPGLVLSATLVMGSFIVLFVLPKLTDFFSAFELALPLPTRILLALANLTKNYGLLLIGGFLGFIFSIYFISQIRLVKPKWHKLLLKLPLFGEFLSYGQLTRFSRNLGVLLKSGVPISSSLITTASTLSNLSFRNDVVELEKALYGGKNISETLKEKKFPEFPLLVTNMIGIGEKTGKLDECLIYLADFYEDEIDNISKNLSTTLEPFLLIIIGLIVGFVALAIISPIYQLTGSIRR